MIRFITAIILTAGAGCSGNDSGRNTKPSESMPKTAAVASESKLELFDFPSAFAPLVDSVDASLVSVSTPCPTPSNTPTMAPPPPMPTLANTPTMAPPPQMPMLVNTPTMVPPSMPFPPPGFGQVTPKNRAISEGEASGASKGSEFSMYTTWLYLRNGLAKLCQENVALGDVICTGGANKKFNQAKHRNPYTVEVKTEEVLVTVGAVGADDHAKIRRILKSICPINAPSTDPVVNICPPTAGGHEIGCALGSFVAGSVNPITVGVVEYVNPPGNMNVHFPNVQVTNTNAPTEIVNPIYPGNAVLTPGTFHGNFKIKVYLPKLDAAASALLSAHGLLNIVESTIGRIRTHEYVHAGYISMAVQMDLLSAYNTDQAGFEGDPSFATSALAKAFVAGKIQDKVNAAMAALNDRNSRFDVDEAAVSLMISRGIGTPRSTLDGTLFTGHQCFDTNFAPVMPVMP